MSAETQTPPDSTPAQPDPIQAHNQDCLDTAFKLIVYSQIDPDTRRGRKVMSVFFGLLQAFTPEQRAAFKTQHQP